MKYLETYTACPHCGQALELSPGARDEVADAVAQAVKDEFHKHDGLREVNRGLIEEIALLRGIIQRYLVVHDAGIVHATAGDSEYSTREEMRVYLAIPAPDALRREPTIAEVSGAVDPEHLPDLRREEWT